MTTTIAIIVARLTSSRLRAKHFLPLPSDSKGNDKPLIEHVLLRLQCCTEINDIVLATTNEIENSPLVDWAMRKKIAYLKYEGDVSDVIGRVDKLISILDPDYVTFICGDCPLIDPQFIDHALKKLKNSQFDTIKLANGIKSIHEGMEFYSKSGWKKLVSVSTTKLAREHVGYGDQENPILEKLEIADIYDYSKIEHRISIDTNADYEFMYALYDRWFLKEFNQPTVDLKWVQKQLTFDKKLSLKNTHVVQRKALKEYGHINIYCHIGKKIGLGHFKRSELIAIAITEYLGLSVCMHILNKGNKEINLNIQNKWYKSQDKFYSAINADKSKIMILDFHPLFLDIRSLSEILMKFKIENKTIIGVDKLHCILENLTTLYIPSFYSKYQGDKISYGWDNYLFSRRSIRKKTKKILILTGGSDALNFAEFLPNFLENYETSYEILWVQGPFSKDPEIQNKSKIKVVYNPEDIQNIIEESDIVLSAYGTLFFEALYRECATILLPVGNLCEKEELEQLRKKDVCLISDSIYEIVSLLRTLETDLYTKNKIISNSISAFKENNGLDKFTKIISKFI